ncbi:hypothetical protein UlMin_039748 [Ulmus minor]
MGTKKEKNKLKRGSDIPAQDSSNPKRGGDGAKLITDSRFAAVHSDPRFRKIPKHKSKVEIDSRFDRMFKDPNFVSSSAPVDKRGKPRKRTENALRHYYRLEEEEEIEEKEKFVGDELETESNSDTEGSESAEEDVESLESESSVDTDDDEDNVVSEDDEPEAPEQQVPEIDKETHRLAVCNMDWRYVKAGDLYMMLSSFLPKGGQIVSVSVYPSEFGLQRMKEEEVQGPVGLFDGDDDGEKDGDDEDDEIDTEKLRAYEKSKLRYYYAVVEFDSIATADYIYKACDGLEFERSSNVLDLRFIPDSMEFKHPPRDFATEAPANYEGLDFQTQALQQSKIDLSWDVDEPDRVKTLKRKFNADQLADLELKEFLASDESGSDDDEDDTATEDKKDKKRDMYRALIEAGDGSDEDGEEEEVKDMEITFNTGLEDISKRILEKKDRKQETVWEATLRKQREKKKLRKKKSKHSSDDESSDSYEEEVEEEGDFFVEEEPSAKKRKKSEGKSRKGEKEEDTYGQAEASLHELELLLADENATNTGLKGYNLKKTRRKNGEKGKEILEEDKIPPVVDDPRFASLFNSPDFVLDPTDPQFKRSATFARQVAKKKETSDRGGFADREPPAKTQASMVEQLKPDISPSKREKYEFSALLKSVKMKSKQIKVPSESNMLKRDERLENREKKGKKEKHDDLSTVVQSIKRKTKAHKK